jgi:hypothetical protein
LDIAELMDHENMFLLQCTNYEEVPGTDPVLLYRILPVGVKIVVTSVSSRGFGTKVLF